LLLEISTK
jgi:hypothetical protein